MTTMSWLAMAPFAPARAAVGLPQREVDGEGRSRADGRRRSDRATVGSDDLLRDEQPQTEAAAGGTPLFALEEAGEDVRQVLLGDAGTGILHLDHGDVPLPLQAHVDALGVGSMGDGIGEQIEEDLLQPVHVPLDHDRTLRDGDVDRLARGQRLGDRGHFRQQRCQIDRAALERELAELDAGRIHQLVDVSLQPPRLLQRLGCILPQPLVD
jgi:hypothetical protein